MRCLALPCLASPELPPRRLDLPLRQRPPPIFVGIWRTGINNSGRLSTQSLAHHTTTMLAQRSLRHPGTPSSWQPAAPCASGADCRVPARPPPRRSAPESRRVEGAAIAVAGAGGPKGAAAGAAQASIMASRRHPTGRSPNGHRQLLRRQRTTPRAAKGKGKGKGRGRTRRSQPLLVGRIIQAPGAPLVERCPFFISVHSSRRPGPRIDQHILPCPLLICLRIWPPAGANQSQSAPAKRALSTSHGQYTPEVNSFSFSSFLRGDAPISALIIAPLI